MIIDGFEHRPGEHCGSTSLRNLASFYGWDLSEPECFGLASGVGFTYLELPMDPWRAFFGRPQWLERAFFENLDIGHTHLEGDDWETAWSAVKNRLDAGDPVMLFVDLYYLDYYGTDTHFAPHSLLLVGYDDTSAVAYVADNEFDEIQELPRSSLRDAWSSKDVVPLEHRYLAVDDASLGTSVDVAAAAAVQETAAFMLDPEEVNRTPMPYGTHGIPGIRALAEDVLEWYTLDDPSWVLQFAYQNVERRGTGGGLFRRLYASFLESTESAIGVPSASAEMIEIADEWTAIGEMFDDASEITDMDELGPLLVDLSTRIAKQADRETAFFRDFLDSD